MPDQENKNYAFSTKSAAIAAALNSLQSASSISVASMAVELRQEIKAARMRGISFRQIAMVFKDHDLLAEADNIRIALGRNVVTKAARARKTAPHKPAVTTEFALVSSGEVAETRTQAKDLTRKDGAKIALRIK